jgi:methionyl-tRNA formyltransferase
VELLKSLEIDLVIVMAYGQILREAFLQIPRLGAVNLHASLLPKLRGASPIHTAMASGEAETGVSLMRIVKKLDAGPVADQEKVVIKDEWVVGDLIEAMSNACVSLMTRALPQLVNEKLSFEEQDSSRVSYCRIIEKADGHLDFSLSAADILRRFRAFQPWPGSHFLHGETMIRVLKARLLKSDFSELGGTVLKIDDDGLSVACGKDIIVLEEMQRAGGKVLDAKTFLRGYSIAVGDRLIGGEAKPLVFDRPYRK